MTVHAIILRPRADALEAVELASDPGHGDTHLMAMRRALDVDIDGWVDDEGRFNGAGENLLATSMLRAFGWHLASDDFIRGSILFAGHDGVGGMASLSDGQRAVLQNAFEQAVRM